MGFGKAASAKISLKPNYTGEEEGGEGWLGRAGPAAAEGHGGEGLEIVGDDVRIRDLDIVEDARAGAIQENGGIGDRAHEGPFIGGTHDDGQVEIIGLAGRLLHAGDLHLDATGVELVGGVLGHQVERLAGFEALAGGDIEIDAVPAGRDEGEGAAGERGELAIGGERLQGGRRPKGGLEDASRGGAGGEGEKRKQASEQGIGHNGHIIQPAGGSLFFRGAGVGREPVSSPSSLSRSHIK